MVTTNENIINRKIILIKKGISIASLSEKLPYTRQGVNIAIVGKSRSKTMHLAICTALGVSLEEFFPEFYVSTVSHDATINGGNGDAA